ncbi:MAG: insulinase family protein [Deltaproteobacteria bacterium]|nr:insulinase family protein [Deltaproteobacteria bacterium]
MKEFAKHMNTYKKVVFDNGLRLVTLRVPHVHSVSLGIWVCTGSRHEQPEQNGISHFLEHMVFKGTRRRDALQIAREIESLGGILNAFTSKEFTGFYVKVMSNHLPQAFDLLSDIFLNSVFDPTEIEREKQVIAQEIRGVEDTPDEYIHDLFLQSYWSDNTLGMPIMGTASTVMALEREAILNYYWDHYRPERIVLAAVGNINQPKLEAMVKKAFNHLEPAGSPPFIKPPHGNHAFQVIQKPLEQVHLCMGTTGPSAISNLRYAGYILDSILGGGMSSRLFQEVREKRGLAYSIGSSFFSCSDAGLLSIYAGTGEESVNEVLEVCSREIKNLRDESLSPEELNRSKEKIKGNLMLSCENTDFRMSRLAKSEIYFDRYIPEQEVLDSIDAVTAEDVQRLAGAILQKEHLALTVMGNIAPSSIPKDLFSQ